MSSCHLCISNRLKAQRGSPRARFVPFRVLLFLSLLPGYNRHLARVSPSPLAAVSKGRGLGLALIQNHNHTKGRG